MIEVEIERSVFLPCYYHLLDNSKVFDIDFLYGGRDSGKSRHVAMQLVVACMALPYFRCLLIRKVKNSVRDSQFSLIKSIIEEWKLESLFTFNETRMEIHCVNGNSFFGRGLDNVGQIKSFNNPSHCWIEEGNQIENDDFVVILTSLRAKTEVKTFFTFNPECEVNYTDFWLYQEWFSHTASLSWEWAKEITTDGGPVQIRARATHTTYKDNRYCSPQRIALYESYKTSKNNKYYYQTYTLGLWGFRKSGGSFWKCFDENIHTALLKLEKNALHFTIDKNVAPYIACGVWQVNTGQQKIKQVYELPCESPENTSHGVAKKIINYLIDINYLKFFGKTIFLYGDPSAQARSADDPQGWSFFRRVIYLIEKAGYKVANRVQRSAPDVKASGEFINEIYEKQYGGWSIMINTECRKSIEDYIMCKEDLNGKVLKKREMNKETGQSYERYGHFTDTKRYFITTILNREFKIYRRRKKPSVRAA